MYIIKLVQKRDIYLISIFLFVLVVIIFLITTPIFSVDKGVPPFVKADPVKLKQFVTTLSGMDRSYSNETSLIEVGNFVKNNFLPYCDSVDEQPFVVEGKNYKNIICTFNPLEEETLVIGAHYDTAGKRPGADDNASGVAGLIELSRLLSENRIKDSLPQKRIELVAYTLEEPPFFSSNDMGSVHHAKMLHEVHANVKLMISLEMIGYYSEEPHSQTFPLSLLKPFYPNTGNFIAIVGRVTDPILVRTVKGSMQEAMQMPVYSISSPAFIPGIDYSDHRSYWSLNFPAIMITDTSFYRNNRYHTEEDTPDTLNYERMADVVNGIYWTSVHL